MRQSQPQPQPDEARTPSFESAPWIAREMLLEEPGRPQEAPLRLAQDDHVIDAELDGEAIRRER